MKMSVKITKKDTEIINIVKDFYSAIGAVFQFRAILGIKIK